MQVEWTDPALDDLEVIRNYIAKDSPYYVRRFIDRICLIFRVITRL